MSDRLEGHDQYSQPLQMLSKPQCNDQNYDSSRPARPTNDNHWGLIRRAAWNETMLIEYCCLFISTTPAAAYGQLRAFFLDPGAGLAFPEFTTRFATNSTRSHSLFWQTDWRAALRPEVRK